MNWANEVGRWLWRQGIRHTVVYVEPTVVGEPVVAHYPSGVRRWKYHAVLAANGRIHDAWRREALRPAAWDDTIDRIEEAMIHRADNRVVELECSGVYPYDGSMVCFRDPKPGLWRSGIKAVVEGLKVDAEGRPTAMSGQSYNMLVGRWDPGRIEPMVKGELLDHLLKDWRPPLPSELLALLWWLNEQDCFNDFEAVRNGLRPILYVYWS